MYAASSDFTDLIPSKNARKSLKATREPTTTTTDAERPSRAVKYALFSERVPFEQPEEEGPDSLQTVGVWKPEPGFA